MSLMEHLPRGRHYWIQILFPAHIHSTAIASGPVSLEANPSLIFDPRGTDGTFLNDLVLGVNQLSRPGHQSCLLGLLLELLGKGTFSFWESRLYKPHIPGTICISLAYTGRPWMTSKPAQQGKEPKIDEQSAGHMTWAPQVNGEMLHAGHGKHSWGAEEKTGCLRVCRKKMLPSCIIERSEIPKCGGQLWRFFSSGLC